jgi:hypothetical protein
MSGRALLTALACVAVIAGGGVRFTLSADMAYAAHSEASSDACRQVAIAFLLGRSPIGCRLAGGLSH